jgi:hypothetical protein
MVAGDDPHELGRGAKPLRQLKVFPARGRVAACGELSITGDPAPGPEDAELTERLRAASELVGVVARDHVIVAAGGHYSFVEAGRWRR